jgi:hypothetical protein
MATSKTQAVELLRADRVLLEQARTTLPSLAIDITAAQHAGHNRGLVTPVTVAAPAQIILAAAFRSLVNREAHKRAIGEAWMKPYNEAIRAFMTETNAKSQQDTVGEAEKVVHAEDPNAAVGSFAANMQDKKAKTVATVNDTIDKIYKEIEEKIAAKHPGQIQQNLMAWPPGGIALNATDKIGAAIDTVVGSVLNLPAAVPGFVEAQFAPVQPIIDTIPVA